MRAVIAIPERFAFLSEQKAAEELMQKIAGVPLLKRALVTASRAGFSDVLLICPEAITNKLVQRCMQAALSYGVQIQVIRISDFDPHASSNWAQLASQLKTSFLWLPWNWVTTRQSLAGLPLAGLDSVDWRKPAFTSIHDVERGNISSALSQPVEGVAVISPESRARAERFLVEHSGKVLDGIHTSFNRRLCRPFVRLLSHTPTTPNAVTLGGVVVSIFSAMAFARGNYAQYVLGALLFYIAGLFDEMDGMLARVKFAESPRGTWLEGFADGLSYIALFTGITIGLSRQYGRSAFLMGLSLIFGVVLALIFTSLGRRRATSPDRPNEYLGRFYHMLEKDSCNWVSRVVRQVQAFEKRGVMIHYIVLFTVLGALPLLFMLATVGAHLTWVLSLYFNHRFFATKPSVNTLWEAL